MSDTSSTITLDNEAKQQQARDAQAFQQVALLFGCNTEKLRNMIAKYDTTGTVKPLDGPQILDLAQQLNPGSDHVNAYMAVLKGTILISGEEVSVGPYILTMEQLHAIKTESFRLSTTGYGMLSQSGLIELDSYIAAARALRGIEEPED